MKKWYCQPDGGMWNVRVTIAHTLTIDCTEFSVIYAEKLTGVFETIHGLGVMVVDSVTLFDEPQDI